jgi:hypothetical protein
MKRFAILFLSMFFVFVVKVDASTLNPSIKIVVPEPDSVVANTFKVNFAIENFKLTTQPTAEEGAGLIAVYVDGKFFTNTASTSAQLYIPRAGTHYIEAELTHVNRDSVVPRVSDTRYVYVQKKSPYLRVKNIVQGSTIATDSPVLDIDFVQNAYEDQDTYYQVFVDGVVDGDSKLLDSPEKYSLKTPLSEGKHSLRLVLYDAKGYVYKPTVDTQISFSYSSDSASILAASFPDDPIDFGLLPFDLSIENFTVGKDGYVLAEYGDTSQIFATSSGTLRDVPPGSGSVRFSLLGRDGRAFVPDISKSVDLPELSSVPNQNSRGVFEGIGVFDFNQGVSWRPGLLVVAFFEAIGIILLATYLAHRHHRHGRAG